MMNHEKVYSKVVKRDTAFKADLIASHQKLPMFTFDTLEMGMWAAAYSGWVLGKFGPVVLEQRSAEWKLL